MKKILLVLLLLIPFNIYAKEAVVLQKCIDGDTASFNINGVEKKVRFLAINAPEYTSKIEFYGKEASDYVCNKLTNAKKIELEYDPKSDKEDKYERVLAWIYVDDKLLQEELVEQGYVNVAYVYDDYMYVNNLCNLQDKAYENKLGIWQVDSREIGYCKTHKNNYYIDNVYVYVVNYSLYIVVLLLFLSLFIIIVTRKKGDRRARYKRNKRS